jgi:GntR family transcriptional repressor for pyruvate dehydrogenase complex
MKCGPRSRAAALFAQRADEDALDRLREHVHTAERALARKSVRDVLTANNAFHDAVASGCGNALLQAMLANLRDRIVLLRVESLSYPGRPARSVTEHRAIIRMIERREAQDAKQLIERHIMHAWRAARAQLAPRKSR